MGLQLEGVVERKTGQGREATGGKRFRRRIHALGKKDWFQSSGEALKKRGKACPC